MKTLIILVGILISGAAIASPYSDNALHESIVRAGNRLLLIQNTDGGWNDVVSDPDTLLETTDASPDFMFGIGGMGLLRAFEVSGNPEYLISAKNAADVLMTKTIYRKNRLYQPDNVFLEKISVVLNDPTYHMKALSSYTAEKEYLSAIFILQNGDPTEVAVNGIDQVQLDTVTNPQRVEALTWRLQYLQRNRNLMVYDMVQRVDGALQFSDNGFAEALVIKMTEFIYQINANEPYYLLGLSDLVSSLKLVEWVPGVSETLSQAKYRLFQYQKPDGMFYVLPPEGVFAGTLQDQAHVVKALHVNTEVNRLQNLLSAVVSSQEPSGAWGDYGFESVISEGEIVSGLSGCFLPNRSLSMDNVFIGGIARPAPARPVR